MKAFPPDPFSHWWEVNVLPAVPYAPDSTCLHIPSSCSRQLRLPYQTTVHWGLTQQKCISHGSGGQKLEKAIQVGVSRGLSPWHMDDAFSLCPHMVFLPSVSISVLISSYKVTSPIGSGPFPLTSFKLHYFSKGHTFLQIQSHSEVNRGAGISPYEFGGTQFSPQALL